MRLVPSSVYLPCVHLVLFWVVLHYFEQQQDRFIWKFDINVVRKHVWFLINDFIVSVGHDIQKLSERYSIFWEFNWVTPNNNITLFVNCFPSVTLNNACNISTEFFGLTLLFRLERFNKLKEWRMRAKFSVNFRPSCALFCCVQKNEVVLLFQAIVSYSIRWMEQIPWIVAFQ